MTENNTTAPANGQARPLAIIIETFAGCTLERAEIERCAQEAANSAVIRHAFEEINQPGAQMQAASERIRNQVNSILSFPQNRNPVCAERTRAEIRRELTHLLMHMNVIAKFAGMNKIEEKPF